MKKLLALALVAALVLWLQAEFAPAHLSVWRSTKASSRTAALRHLPELDLWRSLIVTFEDGADRHVESIQRGGAEPPVEFRARLARLDLEGPLWVPFYKRGRATFEVDVESPGLDLGTRFEGDVDFVYWGIVGRPDVRKDLVAGIRQELVAFLDGEVGDRGAQH